MLVPAIEQMLGFLSAREVIPCMLDNSPPVMNKKWSGSLYLIDFSLGLILCALSWH